MTIYLGPVEAPQTITLDVSNAEPWHIDAVALHHGLGGRTQTVWAATAPDAGQRLTLRCPADQVATLEALLHTAAPLVLSSDDPACAVRTGTGVVRSTRTRYRYDLDPHAADIEVDFAWTT